MSCNGNKSFIKHAADELFVDTAGGFRLDVVGNNIGVSRPQLGFYNDNKYANAIKRVAFKYKTTRNSIRSILELTYGPQKAIGNDFSESCFAGDTSFYVYDASVFVPVGKLILDSLLATEEEVTICRINTATNQIFLEEPLQYDHIVSKFSYTTSSYDYLLLDAATTDTTAIVAGSFPFNMAYFTDGDTTLSLVTPWPVIVSDGVNEEIKKITSTDYNEITFSTGLSYDFKAFKRTGIIAAITSDTTYTYMQNEVKVADSTVFGNSGWISFTDQDDEQIIEFYENDLDTNTLKLKREIVVPAATKTYIEKLIPNTKITTCSVLQAGAYWDIFEARNGDISIYVPSTLEETNLRSASYLHDLTPSGNALLTADIVSGDEIVHCDDLSLFPDAGMIVVDTAYMVYVSRTSTELTLLRPYVGSTLAMATYSVDLVVDEYSSSELPEGNMRDFNIPPAALLDRRFSGPYVYTDRFDRAGSIVSSTLADGMVGIGTSADSTPNPTTLVNDAPISTRVLEVADCHRWIKTPSNQSIDINHGISNYERKIVSTTYFKQVSVSGVNAATLAGVGTLVLKDSSRFPTGGSYFIEIGIGTANVETIEVSSNNIGTNTLTLVGTTANPHAEHERVQGIQAVTNGPYSAGVLTIDGDNLSALPQLSSGLLGFRVKLDAGGANEETLTVATNNSNTLTFTSVTTKAHVDGETIELLSDLLMLSTTLSDEHYVGESVEPLVRSIDLASTTDFPDSGYVTINFGTEFPKVIGTVSTCGYRDLVLREPSSIPTAGGFNAVVNYGLATEESIPVVLTSGDDTIRLQYTPTSIPVKGSKVLIVPGDEEVVKYDSIDGDTLEFTNGVRLKSGHMVGQNVTLSPEYSIPSSDGSTFQFHIPFDPGASLSTILDLIRAAGIEITISHSR